MRLIPLTSYCGQKISLYCSHGTSKVCLRVAWLAAFQEKANMAQAIAPMTAAATAEVGTDWKIVRDLVLTDFLIEFMNLMGRAYLA